LQLQEAGGGDIGGCYGKRAAAVTGGRYKKRAAAEVAAVT
jgi:hypothetical protein